MAKQKQENQEWSEEVAGVEKTKHRSPNYPVIGLRKAVERVKQLRDKYARSQVPIHLVHELWGYAPHGNAGNQCLAAVKSFGLIDVEGVGKNRRVRVNDDGYKVALDSPDKNRILKSAATAPPIYKELFAKYQDDGFQEELIKHFLLFDREEGTFNPDSVDGVIATFLDTLRYSGILEADIIEGKQPASGSEGDEDILPPPPLTRMPHPGAWVNVSDGPGKYLYRELRRVHELTEDGKWVFIEGEPAGKPIDEVFVMQQPEPKRDMPPPPPNPYYTPKSEAKPAMEARTPPPGFKEATLPLAAGEMMIRWPERLSPDEVQDFKDWIPILIRKMERSAQIAPTQSEGS